MKEVLNKYQPVSKQIPIIHSLSGLFYCKQSLLVSALFTFHRFSRRTFFRISP